MTDRPVTASESGRRAKRAGDDAEAVVMTWCERYRVENRAWVEKVPSDIRIIRARGRMTAVPMGGGLDFQGAIAGGRHVAIECKSRGVPRLPLMDAAGKTTILPQQRIRLSWLHAEGALALVLMRLRGSWVVMTWAEYDAAEQAARMMGRASIPLALALKHGRAAPGGDWLTAMEVER